MQQRIDVVRGLRRDTVRTTSRTPMKVRRTFAFEPFPELFDSKLRLLVCWVDEESGSDGGSGLGC